MEYVEYGDSLIYSDAKGYHHVLLVSKVYPSKPQPYEAARASIANILFEQKLKFLIDDWTDKLKEVYETRIFIKGLND